MYGIWKKINDPYDPSFVSNMEDITLPAVSQAILQTGMVGEFFFSKNTYDHYGKDFHDGYALHCISKRSLGTFWNVYRQIRKEMKILLPWENYDQE